MFPKYCMKLLRFRKGGALSFYALKVNRACKYSLVLSPFVAITLAALILKGSFKMTFCIILLNTSTS